MIKPECYFEVYVLQKISYRFGIEDSNTKKYFSTKDKAELEFYDVVSSFSKPDNECKIEEISPLSVKIIENGDKWSYEVSVVKDVIKIW